MNQVVKVKPFGDAFSLAPLAPAWGERGRG